MKETAAVMADDRTVEDFACEHGQALVRFAYMLTGHPTQAQDVTQTILARLVRRGISDLEDPLTYARRSVVNEVISLQRHALVRARALTLLVPRRDDASPVGTLLDRDAIWRALDSLNARKRTAVVLRYYEDLDDFEISQILRCAPATVRSLISRAIPKLHACLTATNSQT